MFKSGRGQHYKCVVEIRVREYILDTLKNKKVLAEGIQMDWIRKEGRKGGRKGERGGREGGICDY